MNIIYKISSGFYNFKMTSNLDAGGLTHLLDKFEGDNYRSDLKSPWP